MMSHGVSDGQRERERERKRTRILNFARTKRVATKISLLGHGNDNRVKCIALLLYPSAQGRFQTGEATGRWMH